MEQACFHLSMPLLQRGWLQIPFSWPVVVSSQIPYPKVPMVSNPGSGPRELGGGSSFCMPPEAEDEPALQPAIWGLPP